MNALVHEMMTRMVTIKIVGMDSEFMVIYFGGAGIRQKEMYRRRRVSSDPSPSSSSLRAAFVVRVFPIFSNFQGPRIFGIPGDSRGFQGSFK